MMDVGGVMYWLTRWSWSMKLLMLCLVSTWMGDRLRTGKPSRHVTSHPGQLSLAIPPWVGAVSTSESWGVNRHTAWYTSPVSVFLQCKLVSGWGLRERRSAPPYGPCGSGETFYYDVLILIIWLITCDDLLCEVLKYKKDAKLADRISRLSVHSTKKKLSRIGRKMIGTQVRQTLPRTATHGFYLHNC